MESPPCPEGRDRKVSAKSRVTVFPTSQRPRFRWSRSRRGTLCCDVCFPNCGFSLCVSQNTHILKKPDQKDKCLWKGWCFRVARSLSFQPKVISLIRASAPFSFPFPSDRQRHRDKAKRAGWRQLQFKEFSAPQFLTKPKMVGPFGDCDANFWQSPEGLLGLGSPRAL